MEPTVEVDLRETPVEFAQAGEDARAEFPLVDPVQGYPVGRDAVDYEVAAHLRTLRHLECKYPYRSKNSSNFSSKFL